MTITAPSFSAFRPAPAGDVAEQQGHAFLIKNPAQVSEDPGIEKAQHVRLTVGATQAQPAAKMAAEYVGFVGAGEQRAKEWCAGAFLPLQMALEQAEPGAA